MNFSEIHRDHFVKVEIADRVAIVTLDRPERKNAINATVHRGLEIVFHELSYHPDVSAIVLTGAGDAFCAGGDMKDYGIGTPLENLRNRDLPLAIVRCEAPVIAAINGAARGLGASIALLCDITYMADDTTIGDVHTKWGLPAGDGGQVMWPLLIGPNRAKEFLMRGSVMDAKEAERIGLVNRIFPKEKVLDEAMACARDIASMPQTGVRWTKLAVNKMVLQQMNLNLEVGLLSEFLVGRGSNELSDVKRREEGS